MSPRCSRWASSLRPGTHSKKQCFLAPDSCSGGLLFSLGRAPPPGRDGRCSCTFFWRLCRATFFPDFLRSLTVSHTQCIFPLRGCLVFPFLKITSVRLPLSGLSSPSS